MPERDRALSSVALLRRKSLRDLVLASPCERGSYCYAKHSLDRERQETARSQHTLHSAVTRGDPRSASPNQNGVPDRAADTVR